MSSLQLSKNRIILFTCFKSSFVVVKQAAIIGFSIILTYFKIISLIQCFKVVYFHLLTELYNYFIFSKQEEMYILK